MEVLGLAFLGLLIVISPGADFVLVLKNSVNLGRKAGIYTAIGISIAICIHISYSMLGISYLISQNELLFSLVRYTGSAYLIYLGVKGIITAGSGFDINETAKSEAGPAHYLVQGFLCNVLNPKTMLFFLSIFSQVISPDSDNQLSVLLYGLYMIMLHAVWFSLIAILLTSKVFQTRLMKMKKRLNQACGAGLISFGAILAIKS
ncbi:LysE family translocator [Photobacterium alginatilyticum]|uniref:LysE family translocator n=1 Tax=Photobacterium alginatilyticum TaxID=1775171 RepID=UPI004069677A